MIPNMEVPMIINIGVVDQWNKNIRKRFLIELIGNLAQYVFLRKSECEFL